MADSLTVRSTELSDKSLVSTPMRQLRGEDHVIEHGQAFALWEPRGFLALLGEEPVGVLTCVGSACELVATNDNLKALGDRR